MQLYWRTHRVTKSELRTWLAANGFSEINIMPLGVHGLARSSSQVAVVEA